jgi:membrane-bound lytic murein transglycosylase D
MATTALLAACATTPPMPRPPAPTIAPPQATVPDLVGPRPGAPAAAPAPATDVWAQLRGSFRMADCDADPAIMSWARRFTQNPGRFESQMQDVLPRLAYVQQVAAKHDVPGEFVLLPWVESHYQPVLGPRNRPAGMWQIMPVTADTLGLHVDRGYDARLDVPAAADAVMAMLKGYYDDLGDWRLVNYAFNGGEAGVRKLVDQHGRPPEQPAIPRLPVKHVTREHLAKLLAIACVVKEPERFGVTLPQLPSSQRLEPVALPGSMPIAKAADQAGMPVDDLKQLNAAFRTGMVDSHAASYLLLPHDRAEQFRNALFQQAADGNRETQTASLSPQLSWPRIENDATADGADTANDGASSPARSVSRKGSKKAATTTRLAAGRTHTVGQGDSLWSIAKRYRIEVKQLQRWNHLRGQPLKPGQVLSVSAPD